MQNRDCKRGELQKRVNRYIHMQIYSQKGKERERMVFIFENLYLPVRKQQGLLGWTCLWCVAACRFQVSSLFFLLHVSQPQRDIFTQVLLQETTYINHQLKAQQSLKPSGLLFFSNTSKRKKKTVAGKKQICH